MLAFDENFDAKSFELTARSYRLVEEICEILQVEIKDKEKIDRCADRMEDILRNVRNNR